MSLSDRLTLGRRLARAGVSIGIDAAASPMGQALPLTPGQLTDPATFERLLRGSSGSHPLVRRPLRVTATAVEAPSSNCRNTVFQVDWERAAGGADAPRTVFVKQPSGDLPTRLFANGVGFWAIECAFCRNLAARSPIPMPRIYAVAERRSRFVLVMENLQERPDTRLFVNRHLLEGVDPDRAVGCLRTLARLHAGYAGLTPGDRDRALPLELHPFLSPRLQPFILALNRLAVAPCRKRAPDVFGETEAALYRRTLEHWDTVAKAWYRRPLTLVHGDSHLGNFFESGAEMGMLDFQGAHWGRGIRDVQYFLINSMKPDVLASRERSLVAGYAEEVTRLGFPLDADEAWKEYRGLSFQALMTAVVSLGLGSFTDSDAVIRAMLERSVAALHRLDYPEWLDTVLAGNLR